MKSKLIEKLEKLKDLIQIENEVDVDLSVEIIDEAIQALQQRESEWISVEDRLPSDNGEYLILDNGVGISLYKDGLWKGEKSLRSTSPYLKSTFRDNIKPTHWMPLPTPPNK